LPVHVPLETQPYYPWSLAWRDEQPTKPVAEFLSTALDTARENRWQRIAASSAHWIPADAPSFVHLFTTQSDSDDSRRPTPRTQVRTPS